MDPQYTRSSPRRSPRTPRAPSILSSASPLAKKTNFYLIRPRNIVITKKVRLELEAAQQKAFKARSTFKKTPRTAEKGNGRLKSERITMKSARADKTATLPEPRLVFLKRCPRITRAQRLAIGGHDLEHSNVSTQIQLPEDHPSDSLPFQHRNSRKRKRFNDEQETIRQSSPNRQTNVDLGHETAISIPEDSKAAPLKESPKNTKRKLGDEADPAMKISDSFQLDEEDDHSDVERGRQRRKGNKLLSLEELKRQLRAKVAEKSRRLARLEEDLRAELEAELNTDWETEHQRPHQSGSRREHEDIRTRKVELMMGNTPVAGDDGEILFVQGVQLEGKVLDAREDGRSIWGDHTDPDDYWKQFDHSIDHSTAATTSNDEFSVLDTSPPPKEHWEQFEHNKIADAPTPHIKSHIKKEPIDAKDELHSEHDRLKEIANENEKWGDHEEHDDYWKQFEGGRVKQLEESRKKLKKQSTQVPVQDFRQKSTNVKKPSSQQRYTPIPSDPITYMSDIWEYEALHAGRHERKPPSPSLSPPPSRPIPSNVRASDPKQNGTQRKVKTQETDIWGTIESLLAASSISPPYANWSRVCDKFFSDKTGMTSFPNPAPFLPRGAKCKEKRCVRGELLGVCHHELQTLFKGNGTFGLAWLKRERLRWHPDRFAGRIGRGEDKREAREFAGEMFRLVQILVDGYGEK
ncbi:hypothetical protein DL95DRAFT_452869 [Leptodontidium sp. 2 PMI_412]|nr:hypothetical protein DL95DRAFT_452869 [Leptodontidium sp. 2 PMI_412]